MPGSSFRIRWWLEASGSLNVPSHPHLPTRTQSKVPIIQLSQRAVLQA